MPNSTKLYHFFLSVPQLAESIHINSDLLIQLIYKGVPIRLPKWVRQGRDNKLTCRSILQIFLAHVKQETEKHSDILDEIQKLEFKKVTYLFCEFDSIRYNSTVHYPTIIQTAHGRVQVGLAFFFNETAQARLKSQAR